MTYEEIMRELAALSPESQKEVADFITVLRRRKSRYGGPNVHRAFLNLTSLGFVGMWRDRAIMTDSTAWVRNLRGREWVK